MRTNELTGAALDWAVAKCEGEYYCAHGGVDGIGNPFEATRYSTNWAQGGPIIEREKIAIICWSDSEKWGARLLRKLDGRESIVFNSPTPLIAAMRCYVTSKLGDDINIPEELL